MTTTSRAVAAAETADGNQSDRGGRVAGTTGIRAKQRGATGIWLPAYTLWQREIVRFYRQKSRVVGVIASPVVFWIVLGSGFGRSFRANGAAQGSYLEYFFPGTIILILLFTAIFTMMSVIEDRKEGFLSGVVVAPCPRVSIALGKILGGTTLAAAEGFIFALLAPALSIKVSPLQWPAIAGVLLLSAFAMTAVGFVVAWRLDSPSAFHAIINLFLIPAWLVSGALFPISGASSWIRWIMFFNPLTYATEALRSAFYMPGAGAVMPAGLSLTVLAAFDAAMLALSLVLVARESSAQSAR
jgi:ABC-2 type transport system permease protein